MKPIESIPAKHYQHKTTKRTASVYGAHPQSGAHGNTYDDWEVVTKGWITRNDNGTVGHGALPFETKEQCDQFIKNWNK